MLGGRADPTGNLILHVPLIIGLEAERSFVPFAAYVAFFPHMIAGPIRARLVIFAAST